MKIAILTLHFYPVSEHSSDKNYQADYIRKKNSNFVPKYKTDYE